MYPPVPLSDCALVSVDEHKLMGSCAFAGFPSVCRQSPSMVFSAYQLTKEAGTELDGQAEYWSAAAPSVL